MTTQLTFWAVNNLYHSPNSSYNEQAQEAFASKSMMRLFVPDSLVGHIVDQLDAMVERGSDPDYDFDASDFNGAEVTPEQHLLLTVKQAVMFLRFLERDIHIAKATSAQKRNFVNHYEYIMKQTLVVMPDDTDPTPAPDSDDTPASDTDVATEPTPAPSDNPPAETMPDDLKALMKEWAWDIEVSFNENTFVNTLFLGDIVFDDLGKWVRVRKVKTGWYTTANYAYLRLEAWRLLAKDNPAVYHRALRNLVLAMVTIRQIPYMTETEHSRKERRAYRRLDRVYRTVSRYKFGVE